jgi:predicted nucleotidyltransferase
MVSKRAIQRVANEIGRKFDPQKIILFGSYARGTATEDSDVDLMIVMSHRGPGYEKATEISTEVKIDFPSDILVRSESEIRARLRMDDYFIQDIMEQGRVLYESQTAGMGGQSRRRLRNDVARVSRKKVSKLR